MYSSRPCCTAPDRSARLQTILLGSRELDAAPESCVHLQTIGYGSRQVRTAPGTSVLLQTALYGYRSLRLAADNYVQLLTGLYGSRQLSPLPQRAVDGPKQLLTAADSFGQFIWSNRVSNSTVRSFSLFKSICSPFKLPADLDLLVQCGTYIYIYVYVYICVRVAAPLPPSKQW